MKIKYYHGSKFGNGARVAEEFKRIMANKGVTVDVKHFRDANPAGIPPADLYVFSSPGRMGKPIWGMRRLLKRLQLPSGSLYGILVTELNPLADDMNGKMPADEGNGRCQRVMPIMDQMLVAKGYKKIAQEKIYVTGMKGPLEEGWHSKVERFAKAIIGPSSTIE